MTPSSIIAATLGAVRMALIFVPNTPKIVNDVLAALDDLPGLVTELGDGEWTDEDVDILSDAIRLALAEVPGVPGLHARRIGRGLGSALDLVVSAVRKEPPADRGHGRQRARKLLSDARANRLPDHVAASDQDPAGMVTALLDPERIVPGRGRVERIR